jgi:adenosylhomocysteine nucleosidase
MGSIEVESDAFKPKRILLMTALPLERDAVIRFLQKTKEIKTESGSIYAQCAFKRLEIFVGVSGAGNLNAGPEVERALATLKPDVAIFSGIAGGIKDVSIGDVVVASKLYGYESGVDASDFKPRPEIGLPSYKLLQIAHSLVSEGKWRSRTAGKSGRDPKVFVGAIAAGEKVVKSSTGAVSQLIRTTFSDTLAVEMVGAAFLRAAYQNRVDAMVVRGISDLLENKGEADKSGSQEIAADHAAAFTVELLSELDRFSDGDVSPSSSLVDPVVFWVRFQEIAARLYPTGPRENDIWLNAGGDLSRLDLSESGRTQWSRALWKLQNGGGGAIDAKRLLTVMLQDFVNNQDLRYLHELTSKSS